MRALHAESASNIGGTLKIALGSLKERRRRLVSKFGAVRKSRAVEASHAGAALTSSKRLSKVLIANRGEIAVRIIRAARDEGIASVAVYADPDRDALHVRLADEAYSLGGNTAAESYLVMDKIIDVARQSGADAIHPGYGFLAENAQFAAKVIDAGITWIGPSPEAISALGDKVQARHIAEKVGAPQVPGTADPVESAEEILEFVDKFGLPVAIKAAFGGGGRGIKVARTREEIPELFESAVREAVAAFGRGECFIERFLDAPATSKPSAWRTPTATWWWSPPATARCSAATRSSLKRHPPRSSPKSRTAASTSPPRRS